MRGRQLTKQEFIVKKMFFALAALSAVSLAAFAASAADVDINIKQSTSKVLQLNLSDSAALDKIVLDQTNAADIVSIVGSGINDGNVTQSANKVIQGNAAREVASKVTSTVQTVQTNALGVVSASLDTKGWSDITIKQSANKVVQGNLNIASAGKLVDVSQVNALNVTDLTINID